MSRKAATSKSKKPAKKPAKPKTTKAYTVVREVPSESPTFTEPDRVFASKGAALKLAEELNRELRTFTNPFDATDPDTAVPGGEKALLALLKAHKLPVPKREKGYNFIDWEAWWDARYFDMTDDQRNAIWDALEKFNWYNVKTVTVE